MKTDKQQQQEDNSMIDEGKFYHYAFLFFF